MNIIKRLVSGALGMCIVVSMVVVSSFNTSAAISFTTMDGFATNQLYSRGMKVAGKILSLLSDSIKDETVKECISFIDAWVLGNSSDNTDEICEEILESTEDIKDVVDNINSKISATAITTSRDKVDSAWQSQMVDCITKHDESVYDFYNIYRCYANYLEEAANEADESDKAEINRYEKLFVKEMKNYYSERTGDQSENGMYENNKMDLCMVGIINSMLNSMDTKNCSVGVGNRFIDVAAQYAYYAYPFSSEQAEYMDYAVEYQMNVVTYIIMIYQDFLAHRAEYFEEKNSAQSWQSFYDEYYIPLIERFSQVINNYLCGEIKLKDVNATTTLDSYVREDSVSVYYDNNRNQYQLKNTNHKYSYKYDGNTSSITKYQDAIMTFNKNASVKVENGKLAFKVFYILSPYYEYNGVIYEHKLRDMDILKKLGNGTLFGGVWNAHYHAVDWKNFTQGVFTDGADNKYVCVSDPNQIKDLINETYYTANNCNPSTYFANYLSYSNGKTNYLYLKGDLKSHDPEEGVKYEEFPAFKMNSGNSYSTNWKSEMIDYDDYDNACFSVILVPQSNTTYSKMDVDVVSGSEVNIEGLSNGKIKSGSTADVTIKVPENYIITGVKALYHGDFRNPSKVTDEKVLNPGVDSNELEINFGVPYTNVTIAVEAKEVYQRITSKVIGVGSVDVKNAVDGKIKIGDYAKINVKTPENYVITSVKALYHSDINDLSKVTSEEVLAKDVISNELELSLLVPTANITIEVETKASLRRDNKGNFIVNDVYDLAQMASMINSGCGMFVNGNYVLTNNIYFQYWQYLTIGTDNISFNGTFNGNGYTINSMGSGASYPNKGTPLFNVLGKNAVVENVNFAGARVSSSFASTGVLCKQNDGTIRNCIIQNSAVYCLDGDHIGGVTDINNGVIENCTVENIAYKGKQPCEMDGIAEINNGVIKNCICNGNSI